MMITFTLETRYYSAPWRLIRPNSPFLPLFLFFLPHLRRFSPMFLAMKETRTASEESPQLLSIFLLY